jgi:hypothetical protein
MRGQNRKRARRSPPRQVPLHSRGLGRGIEGAEEGAEALSTSAFQCFRVLFLAIGTQDFN